MAFKVYLKKSEGNQISHILGVGVKSFTVDSIQLGSGLLQHGAYYIPIVNILFIKEV